MKHMVNLVMTANIFIKAHVFIITTDAGIAKKAP